MANSWLKRTLKGKVRPVRNALRRSRIAPTLEQLGERIVPTVTTTFEPGTGVLSIVGDSRDNTIVVSADAVGNIVVKSESGSVVGTAPTIKSVNLISAFGLGGNDTISLDESGGALPRAHIFGGTGNDFLTGGSGADLLFGEAGNDILLGLRGNDLLFGSVGDDVLVGGAGFDQSFGQAGNDLLGWDPGDGSAVNEGGEGIDTVEVIGGNAAETFTVTANGNRVRFDRTSPAPFFLNIGSTENLVVNANGGNDVVTAGSGLASLIELTIDGGAGNDTITGGDGDDALRGGDGNDVIVGKAGNDTAFLGAGDDTFVWNPGDGSDTVEGEAGTDALQFNGANLEEKIDLSAKGSRLQLVRDIGKVTIDVGGTERVDIAALGGADTIAVNDLSGTAVTEVNLDLSAAGAPDKQADTVIVTGTLGDDAIVVSGDAKGTSVLGLAARVHIAGTEIDNDLLGVNALSGDDVVNAAGLSADAILFAAVGGDGDDILIGSVGDDILIGGAGDDVLIGNGGQDLLDGGPGINIVFP